MTEKERVFQEMKEECNVNYSNKGGTENISEQVQIGVGVFIDSCPNDNLFKKIHPKRMCDEEIMFSWYDSEKGFSCSAMIGEHYFNYAYVKKIDGAKKYDTSNSKLYKENGILLSEENLDKFWKVFE